MVDQALLEFVEVMRELRARCPWKAAQTHRSLVRYLLEEAYETVDAIDEQAEGGGDEHLCEELGDLLLQVVFHAAIAEQEGRFTIDDVAAGISAKMRHRNPHVFGAAAASGLTAAEVNDEWQAIKARDTPRSSVLEGLPTGLPALLLADKVVDRLSREGRTLPAGDGLGERLLALVVEAHESGVDPEQALRDAVRRVGS